MNHLFRLIEGLLFLGQALVLVVVITIILTAVLGSVSLVMKHPASAAILLPAWAYLFGLLVD